MYPPKRFVPLYYFYVAFFRFTTQARYLRIYIDYEFQTLFVFASFDLVRPSSPWSRLKAPSANSSRAPERIYRASDMLLSRYILSSAKHVPEKKMSLLLYQAERSPPTGVWLLEATKNGSTKITQPA